MCGVVECAVVARTDRELSTALSKALQSVVGHICSSTDDERAEVHTLLTYIHTDHTRRPARHGDSSLSSHTSFTHALTHSFSLLTCISSGAHKL